ncbi:MAG: hypothetical protein H6566_24580 [Lewinellaceae bacterium]|nr:hypothetical protein [Lewinellaceae bacterium]
MSTKSCPVCSRPYKDESYCPSCSWELENNIYLLGETQLIERRLQQRLEIAKANWSKVKHADRMQKTTMRYAEVFRMVLGQLKELEERHPGIRGEIGAIIKKMEN